LWIIHDILYVIPATLVSQGVGGLNIIDPFLNNMLKLTSDIPVVGIVLYSLFVFYLLACTLKGNAKLGMNLIIITIHPLM
jgi:LMBR1 domain-containing protein 1